MDNIFEEMKQVFQNFRWIDDIPEDQVRRDKICMEIKRNESGTIPNPFHVV